MAELTERQSECASAMGPCKYWVGLGSSDNTSKARHKHIRRLGGSWSLRLPLLAFSMRLQIAFHVYSVRLGASDSVRRFLRFPQFTVLRLVVVTPNRNKNSCGPSVNVWIYYFMLRDSRREVSIVTCFNQIWYLLGLSAIVGHF